MKVFKSVLEFQKHFDTDEKCRQYLEQQRWGGEPCCAFCGSVKVTRLKGGKRFQCNEKECRKQFSVLSCTVAEGTKIPLNKWFLAMYILSNHSKGISSLQLASWLDVSQKCAWFLNHRVREMLRDKSGDLLGGMVEGDETLIGGSLENRPLRYRKGRKPLDNKSMVFGVVERKGKARTKVVPVANSKELQNAVTGFVKPHSILITDEHHAYKGLKDIYEHHSVNHRAKEYVRGFVHTNSIESLWSNLKKQIVCIHHNCISPKHLQRYCDEVTHRYNFKQLKQDERFVKVIKGFDGRITYRDLTAPIK